MTVHHATQYIKGAVGGGTIEETKLRACEGQLRTLENVPWIHYLKLQGT